MEEFFLVLTIFAVGLTVLNLIILRFLTKKLKKIGLDCMRDAIKSIKIQFGLYVGVYLPFVVVDILRVVFDEKMERLFEGIAFYAVDMAIKTLVFTIPVNYMMYAHWQTMKSEEGTDTKKEEVEQVTTRRSTIVSEG